MYAASTAAELLMWYTLGSISTEIYRSSWWCLAKFAPKLQESPSLQVGMSYTLKWILLHVKRHLFEDVREWVDVPQFVRHSWLVNNEWINERIYVRPLLFVCPYARLYCSVFSCYRNQRMSGIVNGNEFQRKGRKCRSCVINIAPTYFPDSVYSLCFNFHNISEFFT